MPLQRRPSRRENRPDWLKSRFKYRFEGPLMVDVGIEQQATWDFAERSRLCVDSEVVNLYLKRDLGQSEAISLLNQN